MNSNSGQATYYQNIPAGHSAQLSRPQEVTNAAMHYQSQSNSNGHNVHRSKKRAREGKLVVDE